MEKLRSTQCILGRPKAGGFDNPQIHFVELIGLQKNIGVQLTAQDVDTIVGRHFKQHKEEIKELIRSAQLWKEEGIGGEVVGEEKNVAGDEDVDMDMTDFQMQHSGQEAPVFEPDFATPEGPNMEGPFKKPKEQGAASSNMADRIKQKPKRGPSLYLTTPYTAGKGKKKLKKYEDRVESAQEHTAVPSKDKAHSTVIVSDTPIVPEQPQYFFLKFPSGTKMSLPEAIWAYVRLGMDDEVLVDVTGGLQHITRREMLNSMERDGWVLSVVIDTFVCLLKLDEQHKLYKGLSQAQTVWYLPTTLKNDILGKVKRPLSALLVKYAQYIGTFEECEKIYIPVNVSRSHWYLVLIHVKTFQIEIMDTLRGRTANARKREVERLRDGMAPLLALVCKRPEYEGRFKLSTVAHVNWVPTQPNGNDCGIMVMKMMKGELTMDNKDMKLYNPFEERTKLLLYMIRTQGNIRRWKVMEEVRPLVGGYISEDESSEALAD